ncbi:MAG: hypothetical protein HY584_02965 [Candidatus Omnitrophica bacterium]|nr:hypothetical protein [Candidatus Omnitrophota bacterium]
MAEQDFVELLRLFNKHRVRYCIIGAYAFAFHVRPRYTKDMDLLVEPTITNGRKIVSALKEFGFGSLKIRAKDFAEPERFIQLGYEPVRVDLITSIKGCTFRDIWKHRVRGTYGTQPTFFIGKNELILNKEATARKQDQADLELLRKKFQRSGYRRR